MRSRIKKISSYLLRYRAVIITGLVLGSIGSLINVLVPYYIKNIAACINETVSTGAPDPQGIITLVKRALMIIIAGAFASMIGTRLQALGGKKTVRDLRKALNDKIDRVSLSVYDRIPQGDTVSRLTSDTTVISQALSSYIGKLLSSLIIVIGVIVMMFYMNAVLALCVIVSVALGIFINSFFMAICAKAVKEERRLMGNVNSVVTESINGHILIKTFNSEENVLRQFEEINTDIVGARFKSQFFLSIVLPFMDFVSNFTYVVVCVAGGIMILNGKLSIDTLAAFILYIKMFTSPVTQMSHTLGNLAPSFACMDRVSEFMDYDEEENSGNRMPENVKGEVEFSHISFGYLDDQIVIKDFSAHIKPGMKVAVVGPTGAGKSTLINLLMRFYEVNSGDILIDGLPIKEIKRSALHDIFAMVLQETWTFKGSVRDNIVYSTKDRDDADLKAVIDESGLKYLIDTLPEGIETELSESNGVSAGQKQLLTIARAMLKEAPIMILDEATSSVDTRTEKLIQAALDKMTEGHTSFVIAHRLSTIVNADVILVLKDGDIEEMGTHRELLEKNGFYADLYRAGFEQEG